MTPNWGELIKTGASLILGTVKVRFFSPLWSHDIPLKKKAKFWPKFAYPLTTNEVFPKALGWKFPNQIFDGWYGQLDSGVDTYHIEVS